MTPFPSSKSMQTLSRFTQKKKDGKYSVTGRSVVAKDGKTMTSTIKGTNADGKSYSATMVWDKQ